ncbi:MAG: hypothetical protein BWX84_01932 [Verrucomicrobia bacterium ADurb.Bin118]|nr:MAG: hypothetical protein BWX84_01932 [Verrucomicrobia bacterium ADurb.Bin118]
MVAPGGAPIRLQVNRCGGRSASVAVLVRISQRPSNTVTFVSGARTGGVFTSRTTKVKVFVAPFDGKPSSRTVQVMEFVLGPWASPVTQRIWPVTGLMVKPGGALNRLKVNRSAGRSASVTTGARSNSVPSSIT